MFLIIICTCCKLATQINLYVICNDLLMSLEKLGIYTIDLFTNLYFPATTCMVYREVFTNSYFPATTCVYINLVDYYLVN